MAHSKPQDIDIPELNVEEFHALTDLLYEALDGNNAKCARLLGINTKTWMRWNKKPPTWPHWNFMLRHILTHVLASLQARRSAKLTKKKQAIIEALSRIPNNSMFSDQVAHMADQYNGAELHLLRLLSKGGLYWDFIKLPANSGGYSPRSLTHAAKQLKIKRTMKGYGQDKQSFWELPDEQS